MTTLAAAGVLAACVVLLALFRVPRLARAALGRTRDAFRDLRDPALGEREKERAVQAHAQTVLLLGLGTAAASAAAIVLPFGALVLLDRAGVADFDAVVQRMLSPWLLAATAIATSAALFVRRRRP